MKPGRGIMWSGPTTAERSRAAKDRVKQLAMSDIAESTQRRTALETMWKNEVAARDKARKDAVDDYNKVMENAPDFGDDEDGTLRAAWENEPHVQAAKDRMRAHIESSLQEQQGAMSISAAKGSAELGKAQHGSKFQPLAPSKRSGFGTPKYQVKPGDIKKAEGHDVELDGKTINKGGKIFYMGYIINKDGNRVRVGIPEADMDKKPSVKSKPPEEEPTGAESEYRGNKLLRAITGAAARRAQDERVSLDF
jgi:hypothetical protein